MNVPIQPAAPVNTLITIQPVVSAIASHESGAGPNPLSNLASGTLVEGFVVNRDAQNNPILRTAIGDLRVTSEVFLKTGSEVVFRVDTTQASLARIVSVDGLTPQDYSAQNIRGMAQDTVSSTLLQPGLAAQAGKPGAPMAGPPIMQAIMLQHPATPAQPHTVQAMQANPVLAQLAQMRPGAPVRLALLDLKLPPMAVTIGNIAEPRGIQELMPPRPQAGAPAAQPSQAPQNSQAPASRPSAAPQTSTLPLTQQQSEARVQPVVQGQPDEMAPLMARLQQQAQITTLKHSPDALLMQSELVGHYTKSSATTSSVQTLQQPNTPAAAKPAEVPSSNQVTASVIGHEADGANILHTPFATLKLYTPQPLPTGTTLVVQVVPETEAQAAAAPVIATAEEETLAIATRDLKSFEEAITWLRSAAPDVAREMMQKLPGLDHKLASNLLFFIVAIKGGDIGELIGKRAVRELERSAPEILGRLRRDVGQLQSALVDSPLPHWSLITLPMMVGQELHQARLYISKDAPEKDGESDDGRGQRFILDVGLSEIGSLQFDGFVRQKPTAKSFDLMVRMDRPLTPDIREGIQSIFSNSLEISGMHGQVIFQLGQQHFVKPLAETPSGTGTGGAKPILA